MRDQYHHVVVLTGAGVSAESGLKTFRDNGGLWEGHRVEEVATPEAFSANPQIVQQFYNMRRQQLLSNSVNVNRAHCALADFEQAFLANPTNNAARSFTMITQNVDDLHQRAGSAQVIAMHGELLKARCLGCETVVEWRLDINNSSGCAHCKNFGLMRPHIVWFGEVPLAMAEIERHLNRVDLFVSIGTSSAVYPAAGFQQVAASNGAHTVELNLEPGLTASQFDEVHYGPATEIVPWYFSSLRH